MGLLLLQKCQLRSEKAAMGWTRCLLRATYAAGLQNLERALWINQEARRNPQGAGGLGCQAWWRRRAHHCGLKRRLCPTPCRQPWPAPGLLAMGLRLGGGTRGPADARLSPKEQSRRAPGGHTHRNQKSEATQGPWGTAEQRTVVACSQNGRALTVREPEPRSD